MQRFALHAMLLVGSTMLSGCSWKEEKSYDYYVAHPQELYHDYKYCEMHPSAGVCANIVKKYFRYQKNVSGFSKTNLMSKGAIFRDIDEPIATIN